jgi:inorganic pyrophosphatase
VVAGGEVLLLAVPVDDLHPFYAGIREHTDLPDILLQQISHFFEHYKDLEEGKWTKIGGWVDVAGAEKLIMEAIDRAKTAGK